jgi:hypothetical protein
MSVFQVRLRKKHDTKLIEWENRYYVSASDLPTARSAALNELADAEAAIHNAGVTIVNVTVSDLPVGGDFTSDAVDHACGNGISGDELPGILTVNVVANKVGFGRPDRKYYHVFWGETGQAAGLWGADEIADVNVVLSTLYSAMIDADAPLCDAEGNLWQLPIVALREVGHHKFSKRSKRAVAP